MNLVWISILGIVGILFRYGIDQVFSVRSSAVFPWSTFVINVSGSALAGALFTLAGLGKISPQVSVAAIVGFCGGFTTFSAYSVQTMSLLERGQVSLSLIYLILSPLIGLLAAFAGAALVKGLS